MQEHNITIGKIIKTISKNKKIVILKPFETDKIISLKNKKEMNNSSPGILNL